MIGTAPEALATAYGLLAMFGIDHAIQAIIIGTLAIMAYEAIRAR